MDTKELKKNFGKDLTFYGGGVDTQRVLPHGTPQEVRDEVKRRIDDLAPGGGFIFNTVHNIQADVPPENIMAMWEAVREYGVYGGRGKVKWVTWLTAQHATGQLGRESALGWLWAECFCAVIALCWLRSRLRRSAATNDPWTIDFRYAPPWWQTSICLPDDWQKTLVGKDGSLLYDYPGNYAGFGTRITFGLPGETQWLKQELASPRVPIVRTIQRNGDVEIVQETFAVAPPLAAATKRGGAFPRAG